MPAALAAAIHVSGHSVTFVSANHCSFFLRNGYFGSGRDQA